MEFSLNYLAVKPSGLSKPAQIMVMGPFGSGKTFFAGSASEVADLSPVAYIDVEHSAVGSISAFADADIDVFDIKNIASASGIDPFETFMGVVEALLEEDHNYKTVVIDTLDVVNDMALAYYNAKNPTDGFYKWNATREALVENGGLIDQLKGANFLSILVMHIQEDEDNRKYDFAWQGKGARSSLGQYPDLVIHINRQYNKRKKEWNTEVTTVPTGDGQAKNRFQSLIPPVIEGDVRMSDIWGMLETNNKNTNNNNKNTNNKKGK